MQMTVGVIRELWGINSTGGKLILIGFAGLAKTLILQEYSYKQSLNNGALPIVQEDSLLIDVFHMHYSP